MMVKQAAARMAAVSTHARSDDEAELEEVDDYSKLRELLSISPTKDTYCRSALYFVLTGRRRVWTVRHKSNYLVLLFHPNVDRTLLVFCPFVSRAAELAEQVVVLSTCKKFLAQFEGYEIRLARIPELIADEFFSNYSRDLGYCTLEEVDETVLDWVYPSYDIDLQKLLNLEGRKLKLCRKKLRKISRNDIEVLRPADFSPQALVRAVREVYKGWVHTKLTSHHTLGISPRELMSCYREISQLNRDASLAMDGVILKRGTDYIAFSFWERPISGKIVASLAALPVSYEKGLSEYLYYAIAECLKTEKYDEMCVGGSETASLDQFKKKLDPSGVHKLRTLRIHLNASKLDPDPISISRLAVVR